MNNSEISVPRSEESKVVIKELNDSSTDTKDSLMNNLETNLIPIVKGFFHKQSGTISYVVIDSTTNLCAILDTVLDFDYSTGSIFFEHADTVIDFVNENKLNVEWLIETHVHADHLSAAPYIQKKLGGKLCISKEIIKVQKLFGKIYNAGTEFELMVASLINYFLIMMNTNWEILHLEQLQHLVTLLLVWHI